MTASGLSHNEAKVTSREIDSNLLVYTLLDNAVAKWHVESIKQQGKHIICLMSSMTFSSFVGIAKNMITRCSFYDFVVIFLSVFVIVSGTNKANLYSIKLSKHRQH